jgi:Na+-transporting methylmalonyl-CoA/oxaloacetate decarboxylase gamma subunit
MNLGKTFKELCTPAMVYLAISIITIFVALFNGVTIMIVAVKAIFVLFWTFILNLLCKNGMKYVSWFLVLLPYVLIFIGILMNVGNKREGATNMSTGTAERAAAAAAAAAAARAAVAEINRRGQIEQQARA